MSSLTILYPNARRVQIKIQPNTTVLEIIEEACKRQGLEPSEHTLHYQKRTLDISLTFRMTGIANNTTLEIEKLEVARKFQDVVIVLQLSDGSKLVQKRFQPDTTTFEAVLEAYRAESEALQSMLNEQAGVEDVYVTCSFLNEQVVGSYQLKNTTLKDMGLLNGRGLIRLDFVRFDKERFEKKQAEFEMKLEKRARLEKIYEEKKAENLKNAVKVEKLDIKAEEQPVAAAVVFSGLQAVESKEIIDIIEKKPKPDREVDFEKSKALEAAVRAPVNEFADFRFPEATKGKVCNDLGEMLEMERESREACDRQACLVDANESDKVSEGVAMDVDELPEDVFDLTLQDLKSMLSSLKKVQNEEAVMMTKQMRDQEQDMKALKYPNVAIRVCFKNRTYLQGIFRPKESVAAVYKFVEESISSGENSSDDLDFCLYTSPPKKDMKDMKNTLFELGLCPAAQIYFRNKSDRVPGLVADLRRTTASDAREIVYSTIHQKIRQVEDEGLNWLKKEQAAVGKLLKTSSIASSGSTSKYTGGSSSGSSSLDADPAKRKLGSLFLGKKK